MAWIKDRMDQVFGLEPEAMVVISALVVIAIPGIILIAHSLQRHRR
ncbi:MAG: hypothetical protein VYB71_00430 [Chloroflexota bacterium]|nr:hypothetical protein [Chloroflexota bacterium]